MLLSVYLKCFQIYNWHLQPFPKLISSHLVWYSCCASKPEHWGWHRGTCDSPGVINQVPSLGVWGNNIKVGNDAFESYLFLQFQDFPSSNKMENWSSGPFWIAMIFADFAEITVEKFFIFCSSAMPNRNFHIVRVMYPWSKITHEEIQE